MNRRDAVLALLALGSVPPLADAQQPTKIARIGFLGASSAQGFQRLIGAFRSGLRDFGYVERKNVLIEFRWANGKYERLPQLAAELLHANIAVLVTHGTPGVRAAKQATIATPIVMATSGDAVAAGLVSSLSRPEGNITGITFFGPQLAAKRLELLKQLSPRVERAALLVNPDNPVKEELLKVTRTVAESLDIKLWDFPIRAPDELDGAFAAMTEERIEAIALTEEALQIANMQRIADLAAKHRLLSIGFADFAKLGGLMIYGTNLPAMFRRAAYFVDKILKGAAPADLPVEQPTIFEMTVNLKVAKSLGLTIPQSILLRADSVIE